jgi:hypothetical protein
MSAARSYSPRNVTTRRAATADVPPRPEPRVDDASGSDAGDPGAPPPTRVDLSGLSVAGITRRRVGFVASGLLAAWILVLFARQVGDATAASNRAEQLAADNAALAAEVQALQDEADAIVRPEVVGLEARGYQMGDPREVPFTLDPSVPAPVDGAPGSASVRLGAATDRPSPLDSWLSLLFGPTD